jgi:hypothetical protein
MKSVIDVSDFLYLYSFVYDLLMRPKHVGHIINDKWLLIIDCKNS